MEEKRRDEKLFFRHLVLSRSVVVGRGYDAEKGEPRWWRRNRLQAFGAGTKNRLPATVVIREPVGSDISFGGRYPRPSR